MSKVSRLLILFLCFAVLLTFGSCKKGDASTSYDGYLGITDFGVLADVTSNDSKAEAAAKRLGVDAETVKVYDLDDNSKSKVSEWIDSLKTNEYVQTGELTEDSTSVTFDNNGNDNGAVVSYTNSGNTLVILLVSKDSYDQYLNVTDDTKESDWGNFNSGKSYYINDKKIYGIGYISSRIGFLSKDTDSSDPQMIMENATPTYINEYDGCIYACLSEDDSSGTYSSKLYKYDPSESDTEEALTQLSDEDITYFSIVGDSFYYCKAKAGSDGGFTTSGFYRSDASGENEELILEGGVYDTYVVGTKVYYRSSKDNDAEHVYDMLTGTDVSLTAGHTHSFFTDGSGYGYYIYYDESAADTEDTDTDDEDTDETDETATLDIADAESSDSGDLDITADPQNNDLVQVELSTGETKILAACFEESNILGVSDRIYFSNNDETEKVYCVYKDGGFKRISRDEAAFRIMTYHDLLVYFTYADDVDQIDKIYICNLDGSTKIDLTR